jgi:ATP-binding cassette subfamily F protein 3
LREVTWLAMDEPTNHLDLAARTALEELLGDFDGALVCVSHDRAFLDGLCTRILCVEDGRVRAYDGNYSQFHDARLAEQAAREAQRAAAEKPRTPEPRPEPRRETAASGKVRNPWAFEKLEARIIELETQLAALHAALETEDVYRDPARLRDTQTTIAEVERELADCNERWANW